MGIKIIGLDSELSHKLDPTGKQREVDFMNQGFWIFYKLIKVREYQVRSQGETRWEPSISNMEMV